jgi:uncharacterized protein YodC (DUF2158 family)
MRADESCLMEKFKVGELVQHKASGPVMAVEQYVTEGMVRCSWFDKRKNCHANFPEEVLGPPKKLEELSDEQLGGMVG